MKKRYLIFLPLLILTSCGNKVSSVSSSESISSKSKSTTSYPSIDECTTTPQIEKYKKLGYEPLITDSNFRYGFTVKQVTKASDPAYSNPLVLYYKYSSVKPSWTFSQLNSKYDIYGATTKYKHITSCGGLEHLIRGAKDCKLFGVNSMTGSIYMELNAEVEYDHPRKQGEPWPHLLYSQSFTDVTSPKLDQLSSLIVDATYTIEKCDKKMTDAEYVESMHSAQLVLFLTVQNRTKKHDDYGKYIWFGYNLFDYRYQGQEFKSGIQYDAGTGRPIYKTSSKETMKDTNGKQPIVGQKGHVYFDMIDEAKTALEECKKQGYFTTSTWEDMYIGGFNFGYEVPGTFNIAATIEEINFFKKAK